MSYDVHLEADLGGPEPVRVGHLDANYTYNVSPMFALAIDETPSEWDGKPAAAVAQKCAAIIAAFNAEPNEFLALNPANGWGDFKGARAFIEKIMDACHEAPKATVRVW